MIRSLALRVVLTFCVGGLVLPSLAANTVSTQIGAVQTLPVVASAASNEATRQQALDLEHARIWGLSLDEIQRARVLMQPGSVRSAFSPPTLSPVEGLGLHARTDAERARYARLFAQAAHADVERTLAWMAAYSAAFSQLYPNEKVMDFKGQQLPRSMIAP